MDVKLLFSLEISLVLARMNAIDRADVNTSRVLRAYTGFSDDVSHKSPNQPVSLRSRAPAAECARDEEKCAAPVPTNRDDARSESDGRQDRAQTRRPAQPRGRCSPARGRRCRTTVALRRARPVAAR